MEGGSSQRAQEEASTHRMSWCRPSPHQLVRAVLYGSLVLPAGELGAQREPRLPRRRKSSLQRPPPCPLSGVTGMKDEAGTAAEGIALALVCLVPHTGGQSSDGVQRGEDAVPFCVQGNSRSSSRMESDGALIQTPPGVTG